MRILVTGGAGYIGSITTQELTKKGFEVVVFDNLVNGHKEAVSTKLLVGDLLDREGMRSLLANEQFDAVMHFAAYAQSPESMRDPYKYFNNNITGGLNLLEWMREKGIGLFIFSSTCAIFGSPKHLPITEIEEKNPESVYGESKLAYEKVLSWYDRIFGIKHINLRYFNASGAALDGSLGELHTPESHIIPLAIETALGREKEFQLFGTDYDTPDGTCIRDYIHVVDLARAHILALEKLAQEKKSASYNLGSGKGYSNKEVVDMVKKVSGVDFLVKEVARRSGDPPMLYADNTKIVRELGFALAHSDLETIIKTAWDWHKNGFSFKKNSPK